MKRPSRTLKLGGDRGVARAPRSPVPDAVHTALMATVILLSLLTMTHVSLALWNGAEQIPLKTVVSGTLTATVAIGDLPSSTSPSAEFPAGTWSGMLPGESRRSTFTVANTGSAPFILAASVDAESADNHDVHFAVATAPCSPDGTGLQGLTAAPVTLGRIQPAQAVTYCLAATLDAEIPAGAQDSTILNEFTVDLAAAQAAR
jgi:hypothetical protein